MFLTDLEVISLEWEKQTGYDSIATIKRVYGQSPSGAYQCVWPDCAFVRKDATKLWMHVHTAHSPSSLPPFDRMINGREGTLTDDCGLGASGDTAIVMSKSRWEALQAEAGRLKAELASEQAELKIANSLLALGRQRELSDEVERLRARVVMFLRCHYEEHEHIGSPTCFDVQSPSDEWESAALASAKPE